jgi:hypothetical protein
MGDIVFNCGRHTWRCKEELQTETQDFIASKTLYFTSPLDN